MKRAEGSSANGYHCRTIMRVSIERRVSYSRWQAFFFTYGKKWSPTRQKNRVVRLPLSHATLTESCSQHTSCSEIWLFKLLSTLNTQHCQSELMGIISPRVARGDHPRLWKGWVNICCKFHSCPSRNLGKKFLRGCFINLLLYRCGGILKVNAICMSVK